MAKYLGRRDFIASVALVGIGAPLLSRLGDSNDGPTIDARFVGMPFAPAESPFELHQVRLRPGIQRDAQLKNREFLMAIEPDRLLHTFRLTAGIPSSARPLGGWEAPANELRGTLRDTTSPRARSSLRALTTQTPGRAQRIWSPSWPGASVPSAAAT